MLTSSEKDFWENFRRNFSNSNKELNVLAKKMHAFLFEVKEKLSLKVSSSGFKRIVPYYLIGVKLSTNFCTLTLTTFENNFSEEIEDYEYGLTVTYQMFNLSKLNTSQFLDSLKNAANVPFEKTLMFEMVLIEKNINNDIVDVFFLKDELAKHKDFSKHLNRYDVLHKNFLYSFLEMEQNMSEAREYWEVEREKLNPNPSVKLQTQFVYIVFASFLSGWGDVASFEEGYGAVLGFFSFARIKESNEFGLHYSDTNMVFRENPSVKKILKKRKLFEYVAIENSDSEYPHVEFFSDFSNRMVMNEKLENKFNLNS